MPPPATSRAIPPTCGYNGGAGTADPLPPAGHLRPARRHGAGRGAPARRHPVRQRLAGEYQRRLRPDLGPGEVDQPSDPGQPRGHRDGYFDYFNGPGAADGPAGPRGKGYYSFDLGAWHLVALNSNCSRVACSAGSEQESWLRADLAAHPASARSRTGTIRASARGTAAATTSMQPLWAALHDAQARARCCRATATTTSASRRWTATATWTERRASGSSWSARAARSSRAAWARWHATQRGAQNNTFGVLRLTLHQSSYDWRVRPGSGTDVMDSGSRPCHGLMPPRRCRRRPPARPRIGRLP